MSDWFEGDLSTEEFKRIGYRVIDEIAEYLATVRDVPVFAAKKPGEVEAVFDEPMPEDGQTPDEIVDTWREKIVPNATHLGSPRYFGFVNGSGSHMAVFADAMAAAVNMNSGGWKPAPSATEIERRALAWLAELIGYDVKCGGLITSGGMMANFTALHTALKNVAPHDLTPRGLQDKSATGRFLVYVADHEGHVSLVRVMDMMNLGREALRRVRSHDDFTMDVAAMRQMIIEDKANGDIPFCVVAQVGSINVGCIDPLNQIADICSEFGLWFHCDGACGAVGAMLPEKRGLYAGLEWADSITLDPHKWLYIPYECGCVLIRDGAKQRRAFSMQASYLRGTLPDQHLGHDYYETGPQMSRGFKALKLWMTMKHYGAEGYRRLLRQNLWCAEQLDELVRDDADFEALHKPIINIYSFRFAPESLRGEKELVDQLNQQIADAIQLSGFAFIMTTKIHGRTVLRLSICSHRTTLEDIEAVFAELKRLGSAFAEELRPAGAK
jgi:glutamate/tyrosine decarboxylase-like PLP-dependent enzyme